MLRSILNPAPEMLMPRQILASLLGACGSFVLFLLLPTLLESTGWTEGDIRDGHLLVGFIAGGMIVGPLVDKMVLILFYPKPRRVQS